MILYTVAVSIGKSMSSDIHPSAQKVLDGDTQIRERYGVVVTRAQDGDCELQF